MQKTIVGNWKMNGTPDSASELALAIVKGVADLSGKIRIILCPPACLLYAVAPHLATTAIKLGGQNCHVQPEGAFTGDISAPMLKDAGCEFVIVGHSERRKYHHESNVDVRQKAARAIKTGLTPIICIGETEQERDAGRTKDVLGEQIRECIPEEVIVNGPGMVMGRQTDFMLAYEPVWAIGSGKTPTVDDIRQIHAYIIAITAKRTGLDTSRIHVLYGGSVKAENAREIVSAEGVSGVLIGGASLKAKEFCAIVGSAA